MVNILLARRYLFRGKAKHISFISIASSLGIVIGVAAVIVALSIVNGIDGGLMERIMRFKPHLIVEGSEEKLREIQDKIVSWPGVDNAFLAVQSQVFAKMDTTIIPLVVRGMEFGVNHRGDLTPYILHEYGNDGFYVGKSLIRRFNIKDSIEFYPLEKKLELMKKPIRGIFTSGLYDIDNYFLITDLETARNLSQNYHLTLEVKINDPYAVAAFKDKMLETFQGGGFYVSTWIETNEALFATLKLEKFAMLLILSLIILISSFNIFAMLTVKVVEKTKDIGIMKALGFSSRRVAWIFAMQGIMIGLIGTGLGTALGLGICKFLKTYPVVKLPQEVFFTENLPIVIEVKDLLVIAVVAIGISIIASLFPARKAGSMEVCEALRYE
jgi:lipoprotein-releasing system permease protein